MTTMGLMLPLISSRMQVGTECNGGQRWPAPALCIAFSRSFGLLRETLEGLQSLQSRPRAARAYSG